MKLRTWTVRSLYRSSLLTIAARKLARYKLNLVGVKEDIWGNGGAVSAEEFNFLWNKKRISSIGNTIF
jgi:hypothetical protein